LDPTAYVVRGTFRLPDVMGTPLVSVKVISPTELGSRLPGTSQPGTVLADAERCPTVRALITATATIGAKAATNTTIT
jgi:hypothetical protein